MTTCFSIAITFLILLAGTVNADAAAETEPKVEWGKEVKGFRFVAAPVRSSFRYDQPVKLRMTIKNVKMEETFVLFTSLMKQFRFDVRLPNGKPAPLTLEGRRQVDDPEFTGVSFIQLEPGESHTQKLSLNRYYDMTLLGEYTVTIYRRVPSSRADGKSKWIEVPSNTVKIVVRDYTAEEIEEQQQRESNEQ